MLMFVAAALFAGSMNAQDANATLATMDVTLQRVIEIALAENPTIKVAEKEIEIKKVADTEAWMNLLPEASVNLSLQHTLLAAEMKLNGQSFKMGRGPCRPNMEAWPLSLISAIIPLSMAPGNTKPPL